MATISWWNTSPSSLSWPFTHFSPIQLYLCGPDSVLLYQSCLLGVCVLTTMVWALAFTARMECVQEISTYFYSYCSAIEDRR
jgi:hypothetical protein